MKAVENDFAKQTHCRLTVAEEKKKSKAHVMSSGLILYIITGGRQKSRGNSRR